MSGGSRLPGGTGFHLREGPVADGCAEIGMFIRQVEAGAGLGTRVLLAMLDWGFSEWPWLRLAWRCPAVGGAVAAPAEHGEAYGVSARILPQARNGTFLMSTLGS